MSDSDEVYEEDYEESGKKPLKYWTDFSLKCGSFGSAFCSLCVAVVTYIVLPLSIIALIDGVGADLSAAIAGTTGIDFGQILLEIKPYLDMLMLYSIPLIFLSIPIGFYPAGNYARIPFKVISALYLAALLLMFTNGGFLSITIDASGMGVPGLTSVGLDLQIQAIIYILALISAAKGFLAFAEFSSNRKDYLEELHGESD